MGHFRTNSQKYFPTSIFYNYESCHGSGHGCGHGKLKENNEILILKREYDSETYPITPYSYTQQLSKLINDYSLEILLHPLTLD